MVLVIFSCTALGYGKSAKISRRLLLLREIEKALLLLMGEITYRKEALPEAMIRISGKVQEPLGVFFKETATMAKKYPGEPFAHIFKINAEKYLRDIDITQKDFEEFVQLGEYLGYLDIDMQKNTSQWYLQQLKIEMKNLAEEIPVKKKLYQSLGVLSGIFLAILLM